MCQVSRKDGQNSKLKENLEKLMEDRDTLQKSMKDAQVCNN